MTDRVGWRLSKIAWATLAIFRISVGGKFDYSKYFSPSACYLATLCTISFQKVNILGSRAFDKAVQIIHVFKFQHPCQNCQWKGFSSRKFQDSESSKNLMPPGNVKLSKSLLNDLRKQPSMTLFLRTKISRHCCKSRARCCYCYVTKVETLSLMTHALKAKRKEWERQSVHRCATSESVAKPVLFHSLPACLNIWSCCASKTLISSFILDV